MPSVAANAAAFVIPYCVIHIECVCVLFEYLVLLPVSFPFNLSFSSFAHRLFYIFSSSSSWLWPKCTTWAHCRHYIVAVCCFPHLPSSSLTFAFVEWLFMYWLSLFFFFFFLFILFFFGISTCHNVLLALVCCCCYCNFVISFAVLFSFVKSLCFIVVAIVPSDVICDARTQISSHQMTWSSSSTSQLWFIFYLIHVCLEFHVLWCIYCFIQWHDWIIDANVHANPFKQLSHHETQLLPIDCCIWDGRRRCRWSQKWKCRNAHECSAKSINCKFQPMANVHIDMSVIKRKACMRRNWGIWPVFAIRFQKLQ